MDIVSITIDGKEARVAKDSYIIEVAKQVNIDIPALCYDPNLEVVGACRLCLVEVEGWDKLQTACSTVARDGMVVYTESDKVVRMRKEILQLLLDNHPNDCLTCHKAGECLLQEYAYRYDVKFREHSGARRPEYVDSSSPYILKDDSKCILCGKCIRTCYELEERQVLSFANRGFDTRVVLDTDKDFETSKCVSCNRCVSVCPVGALIDKREMNKIRSWQARKRTVNCRVCAYGCEFETLAKGREVLAVRAKEPANGRPLCLKGRLTTELLYVDKPDQPYRKIGGKFIEADWAKVIGVADIIEKIEKLEE